jgi:hypothetical protein
VVCGKEEEEEEEEVATGKAEAGAGAVSRRQTFPDRTLWTPPNCDAGQTAPLTGLYDGWDLTWSG